MISSYFIDVIGGLYKIGEIITIKTSKASTKREIKITDQSNNKVSKNLLKKFTKDNYQCICLSGHDHDVEYDR